MLSPYYPYSFTAIKNKGNTDSAWYTIFCLINNLYIARLMLDEISSPPPPDTTTLALLVSFSPITQPEDDPIKGPKHVVVSPILH
jgi:hypothetical protein